MCTWTSILGRIRRRARQPARRPRARLAFEALEHRAVPAAYYVSPLGNDAASGASPAEAWQTIWRANLHDFEPGDWLLFQGGGHFSGPLLFDANDGGTPAHPVTITSYGTGSATLHSGAGVGLLLHNAGGFNISNLVLVGAGPYANSAPGIFAYNQLDGDVVLEHLRIDNVDVSGYGASGIFIQGDHGQSGYRDVRVTWSRLHNNLGSGLATLGSWYTEPDNYAQVIHDLYVGHVEVYDTPGIGPPSTGINLGGVAGGLVERSVMHHNGAAGGVMSGVWVNHSSNVTLQFNIATLNRGSVGGAQGNGFTFERGVTNSVMQYNYTRKNDGAGYALWAGSLDEPAGVSSDLVVRFNISENDARTPNHGSIAVYGGVVSNTEIYNNTVYLKRRRDWGNAALVVTSWAGVGLHIRNNLFQTADGAAVVNVWEAHWGTDLRFEGNNYYSSGAGFRIWWEGATYRSLVAWRQETGQELVNGWATGHSLNPRLLNAGRSGLLLNADLLAGLFAYQLKSTSPLRHAGLDLAGNFGINPGPRDFFGNGIPQETYFTLPIGAATRPGT